MSSLARRIGFDDADEPLGEDPFDIVADGGRLRIQGNLARAKRLRHSSEVRPVSSYAIVDPTPEHAEPEVRRLYKERVRELLVGVMDAAGVACGDVGAAIALSESMVIKSRAPRGRSLLLAELLAMADRGPPPLRAELREVRDAVRALEARLRERR